MPTRPCSAARALEVLGARWALLVLREVNLGNHRFDDIQRATGAPRAALSARLTELVAAGLLQGREYRVPGARPRTEYCATPAGRDLQPVLAALMDWGDRYRPGPDGPPARLVHRGCDAAVHARLVCEAGHQVGELDLRPYAAGSGAALGAQ